MIYEVSWAKKESGFRWIAEDDGEVYMTFSGEGEFDIVDTNNEIGRMLVECSAVFTDGHVTCTPTLGLEPVLPPADAELRDWAGYCRMCYRRAQQDWRIVDEKRKVDGVSVGSGTVEFVQTFVGRVKLYWYDKASHLFHGHPERRDGLVYVKDHIAYFA